MDVDLIVMLIGLVKLKSIVQTLKSTNPVQSSNW